MLAAIVHYNTQELTTAAIRSLWIHHPDCRVVVYDNSDRKPFVLDGFDEFNGQIEIIDNTQGQIVDFERWLQTFPDKVRNNNGYASAKHAYSVQWLIDHIDEPFLLIDSDVLIQRDLTPICNPAYAAVGEVAVNPKLNDAPRLLPILCYINTHHILDAGIRYFNADYMWAITSLSPNNRYDTGAWFLRDLQEHHLPYLNASIAPYAIHFGHGSWKDKDGKAWLNANRNLWKMSDVRCKMEEVRIYFNS